jgi:polyhydroxyalkanoate synthase
MDVVRELVGRTPTSARPTRTYETTSPTERSAALDAFEKANGRKDANVSRLLPGGTLLAGDARPTWRRRRQKRIASATFMTSLIDFTRAGELEVFIDEARSSSLERKMSERGYLEGSEMANTFNMLRATTSSGRSSSTTT